MNRKLLSILLCLVMVLSMVPMAASAEESHHYLAIGDSITTGNGLAEPDTQGFTYHISNIMGYVMTNAAVDGLTAEALLAKLTTGELDAAIADAEVITITCGGNDLMHALYEAVALEYNTKNNASITSQDVIDALAGKHPTLSKTALLPSALGIINTFVESQTFKDALDAFEANMNGENGVMAYIRGLNPDAIIVMTTQYNPYKFFTGVYQTVTKGIEEGVAKLNTLISDYAVVSGYAVADVYSAFNASAENLCNATMQPLELDFHPNAAGHKVIADVVVAAIRDNCDHVDVDGICAICGGTVLPRHVVTVTFGQGGQAFAIKGDDVLESASEGDVVELFAMPEENSAFVGWEVVSGDAVIADPTAAFTSFVMPAGPVELKAIFLTEGETEPEPEPEVLYGDANGDTRINSKDASLVLEYAMTRDPELGLIVVNADVNGDGKINSKDAAMILERAADRDMKFPVEEQ